MCITPDKEDHLWFGTNGGGISEYGGYSSTGYQTSQRLDISTTYCILRDKKGDIWFGANGGVIKYDGKTFANYTVAQGLPANTVVSMMQDRSGNIWFGTNRGASKFNGKTFTNYTTAQGLASDYVRSIVQDRSGNIWFCFSHRGGASKYDGKSFSRFTTAQGLPKNYVFSMTPDKSGDVWFATDSGASKFDGRRFTNFTIRQGLQSNHILCLTQDSKGDLWFGTDKGASKYDGERFTNFTTSNGLPNNSIWSIVEDSTRNMMWLGTDLGISGLKQNSSGAGYAFQNFSIKTGDYIKDIYGLGFDNNGILWLGCSGNKLIRFDYEAVHKSAAPLEVEIQNIKVNNEYICWNSLRKGSLGHPSTDSLAQLNEMVTTFGAMLSAASLDSMRNKFGDLKFDSLTPFNPVPVNLCLPYHDNNISFDFVAIEPALPKQVKYQYKLEGFDEDWAPPGNASLAVYSNLREGVYTFRLKALSPYGVWSETSYRFKVLPPWQRTWWAYTLFAVAVIGMLWGVIYYRSRRLRRANLFLEEKVAHRTNQLQESLEDLKSAQSQLVHAEKMASLGELTAGIAHEIQNPLNFINNFSEVNQELLAEMKEEIDKGNFDDVKSTAGNVMENEQKILHHGKRADAIVKGMLQHSRTSTGLKEPTDINGLADEYLRLSYHGIRAKEKGFHAETKTAYDENIGNVPVVPQDIGRVLLNLYNNAFYAVAEKEKLLPSGYEPSVAVSTKKTGDRVEIRVRDNGMGIPQKAVDKIFQPFFTTKPAGSGTGLGLSLSYDIIKAHGGEITVQTKEGEGTEFVVRL
jgi:signal transduction histidine kinase/ligand-binding sensor domain-containing protein